MASWAWWQGREVMSSRPLFQHSQTKYREGKYRNRCPACFIGDYRLRQGTNTTEIPHDKCCQGRRTAQLFLLGGGQCAMQGWCSLLQPQGCADHSSYGWAPWFPQELKTHTQGKCCRHCFRFSDNPQSEGQSRCPSGQVLVHPENGMLLTEKSWTIKSWAHTEET